MLTPLRGTARAPRFADRRTRVARVSAPPEHDARREKRNDRRARIAWALGRAPHEKRLVLALLLVERLSAAEAASALGVPVARLRGYYRDALAHLRRMAALDQSRDRARRMRPADRFRKAS